MLNEKQLSEYFKIEHLPIKDGEWWDGKPFPYSNLNKWHPTFSQKFGMNPEIYKQFGMKGHNGIDIAYFEGTPVVAPCKLWVSYLQDDPKGYGRNVFAETESKQINGDYYKIEMCFGHNKEFSCQASRWVEEGELLAFGDSTGFSTGPHCHYGIRPWIKDGSSWKQVFNGNGYLGWINPDNFLPHIVWDLNELNFMDEFKQKNDGKLIFNNDTGEIGWFYNNKLRIPEDADRGWKMLASYLIKKDGVNINDVDWDKLPKEKF